MGCCTDYYKTISAINCRTLMAVEKFEIWIPEFDSSGVANKISIADAKLLASWVAKINASGSSNKFYPLPFMDNIVDERADDVFESLDSGANINVKQGDRDFLGFFIQEPNCILSEVEAWQSAGTWGKYVIDKDGNILYRYCSTDPLNMFASALDTVQSHELMIFLGAYMAREDVEKLVVGLPMNLDGNPSESMKYVKQFLEECL